MIIIPAVCEQTPSKQLMRGRMPDRQSLSRRHSPRLLSYVVFTVTSLKVRFILN